MNVLEMNAGINCNTNVCLIRIILNKHKEKCLHLWLLRRLYCRLGLLARRRIIDSDGVPRVIEHAAKVPDRTSRLWLRIRRNIPY